MFLGDVALYATIPYTATEVPEDKRSAQYSRRKRILYTFKLEAHGITHFRRPMSRFVVKRWSVVEGCRIWWGIWPIARKHHRAITVVNGDRFSNHWCRMASGYCQIVQSWQDFEGPHSICDGMRPVRKWGWVVSTVSWLGNEISIIDFYREIWRLGKGSSNMDTRSYGRKRWALCKFRVAPAENLPLKEYWNQPVPHVSFWGEVQVSL